MNWSKEDVIGAFLLADTPEIISQDEFDEVKSAIIKLNTENESLKYENRFLKLSNPEQNLVHFDMMAENKRKIDMLRHENRELKYTIKELKKMVGGNDEGC